MALVSPEFSFVRSSLKVHSRSLSYSACSSLYSYKINFPCVYWWSEKFFRTSDLILATFSSLLKFWFSWILPIPSDSTGSIVFT